MSIKVMDGFELYNGASGDNVRDNLDRYWTGSPSTDTWTLRSGRYGGFSIEPIYVSGEQIYKAVTVSADGDKIFLFLNFYINSAGLASDVLALPLHTDGTGIKILGDGTVGIIMEETDMSSTSYVMSTTVTKNTWHSLQVEITKHGTTAQTQNMWIDGTLYSGSSTCANITRFGIDTSQQSAEVYLDDLVFVLDDSTEFSSLPDANTKIVALQPIADGTYEDWTLSTGSNSYDLVDDTPPADDDSSYIYSSTTNEKTTFDFTDLSGLNVEAVKVMHRTRNTDALSSLTVKVVADTTEAGSADTPGVSYDNYIKELLTNPVTSGRWTTSDFNAMEFGVKVTAGGPS